MESNPVPPHDCARALYAQVHRTWLHRGHRVIASYPWLVGGRASYLYTETDPGQETDYIHDFRSSADEHEKRSCLTPLLNHQENEPLPSFSQAVEALSACFPAAPEDIASLSQLEADFHKAVSAEPGKEDDLRRCMNTA